MSAARHRREARLPLIHTCPGHSAPARVAQEVADRIVEIGRGRRAAGGEAGVAEVRAAAAAGEVVVSLNGCGSACGLLALDEAGVGGVNAIRLSDLRGCATSLDPLDDGERNRVVDAVLEHIAPVLAGDGDGDAAAGAGAGVAAAGTAVAARRSHAPEDYLRAVWLLASPHAGAPADVDEVPVHAAAVARVLGVSKPTAGEMMQRLEAGGHVTRGARREVVLTARGRQVAEQVIRRHRIVERFLVNVAGCDASDVYAQAATISGGADRYLIERFHAMVAGAERCPHGWPFDPAADRAEMRMLVPLASLGAGERAEVVRLPGSNVEMLCMLAEHGVVPGARVHTVERRGVVTALVDDAPADAMREGLPLPLLDGVFVRLG